YLSRMQQQQQPLFSPNEQLLSIWVRNETLVCLHSCPQKSRRNSRQPRSGDETSRWGIYRADSAASCHCMTLLSKVVNYYPSLMLDFLWSDYIPPRLCADGLNQDIVTCTSCGSQVNHFRKSSLFCHPILNVLLCKTCYLYYMSDDIDQDAEGGKLICCDYCNNAFCRSCVQRNFGRAVLHTVISETDRKWRCYVCDPEPLRPLVAACKAAFKRSQEDVPGKRRSCQKALLKFPPLHSGAADHYTDLVLPREAFKKAQRLAEASQRLAGSFLAFLSSEHADTSGGSRKTLAGLQRLRAFRAVLIDLRKAQSELQIRVEEEIRIQKDKEQEWLGQAVETKNSKTKKVENTDEGKCVAAMVEKREVDVENLKDITGRRNRLAEKALSNMEDGKPPEDLVEAQDRTMDLNANEKINQKRKLRSNEEDDEEICKDGNEVHTKEVVKETRKGKKLKAEEKINMEDDDLDTMQEIDEVVEQLHKGESEMTKKGEKDVVHSESKNEKKRKVSRTNKKTADEKGEAEQRDFGKRDSRVLKNNASVNKVKERHQKDKVGELSERRTVEGDDGNDDEEISEGVFEKEEEEEEVESMEESKADQMAKSRRGLRLKRQQRLRQRDGEEGTDDDKSDDVDKINKEKEKDVSSDGQNSTAHKNKKARQRGKVHEDQEGVNSVKNEEQTHADSDGENEEMEHSEVAAEMSEADENALVERNKNGEDQPSTGEDDFEDEVSKDAEPQQQKAGVAQDAIESGHRLELVVSLCPIKDSAAIADGSASIAVDDKEMQLKGKDQESKRRQKEAEKDGKRESEVEGTEEKSGNISPKANLQETMSEGQENGDGEDDKSKCAIVHKKCKAETPVKRKTKVKSKLAGNSEVEEESGCESETRRFSPRQKTTPLRRSSARSRRSSGPECEADGTSESETGNGHTKEKADCSEKPERQNTQQGTVSEGSDAIHKDRPNASAETSDSDEMPDVLKQARHNCSTSSGSEESAGKPRRRGIKRLRGSLTSKRKRRASSDLSDTKNVKKKGNQVQKPSSKRRRQDDDDTVVHSDSSNFDSDLEKEIAGLCSLPANRKSRKKKQPEGNEEVSEGSLQESDNGTCDDPLGGLDHSEPDLSELVAKEKQNKGEGQGKKEKRMKNRDKEKENMTSSEISDKEDETAKKGEDGEDDQLSSDDESQQIRPITENAEHPQGNLIQSSAKVVGEGGKLIWESPASEKESEGSDDDQTSPSKGRKKIRKIIKDDKLRGVTQQALKEEEERRKRVADREKEREKLREVSEILFLHWGQKLVLEEDAETKEALVQVHHSLVCKLKPHQVDGVQFMWDCCVETVKKSEKECGSGCIVAHCMGLGKTLQVVAFLHTVLRTEQLKFRNALIVCPLNTVLNWINEFQIWLGDIEDEPEVWELTTVKRVVDRARMLRQWMDDGGIMIMGYEMYRNLTSGRSVKSKKQREIIEQSLVDPGPDFVICDEGHILKNELSAISKAMNAIRTRRRIVLTGTPLQNNLLEYHCMVNFIKENLLGSSREFRNRFINPIQNGQCSDSTLSDVRVMKKRAHILYELLAGCVQRKDYTALTKFLPPKHEYVLSVRLSPLQCQLYRHYLDHFSGCAMSNEAGKGRVGTKLFTDYQMLSRIWTHPWCLQLDYISKENRVSSTVKKKTKGKKRTGGSDEEKKKVKSENSDSEGLEVVKVWNTRSRGGVGQPDIADAPAVVEGTHTAEWYKEFVKEDDAEVLEHSGKLLLLLEILRMAEELTEKVLVFSQSLISLDLIEDFLKLSNKEGTDDKPTPYKGNGKWYRNIDYYRMDGSTSAATRKKWAEDFNDEINTRGRLFLISTKAGSLGINLVAANRVIVFDASWNPSYDIQSIFRVYRFGQNKHVFVYRLLAQGTMEEKIYDRQVTKQSLSFRVVDQQQVERHFTMHELGELYSFEPDHLDDPNTKKKKRPTPRLPKDRILAELLQESKDTIVEYHEHDSLLDHKQEEELTEEERKAAWAEYEAEKKVSPFLKSSHDFSCSSLFFLAFSISFSPHISAWQCGPSDHLNPVTVHCKLFCHF
uniref:DNA helicase n=1 Tax=Eptatretus burgeri TaxID=7764 RepID=A0A8C4Q5Z1_EPTBU